MTAAQSKKGRRTAGKKSVQDSADLDDKQASQTLARLQACADVARAATSAVESLVGASPGASPRCQPARPPVPRRARSSFTSSAVDQAEQSLQSFFCKARDVVPGRRASSRLVPAGRCTGARMEGADEARGAKEQHAPLSLHDPLDWAGSEKAVRGRAFPFPVAFASSRGRDAGSLAVRAEMISAWFCRASTAPLDEKECRRPAARRVP